MTRPAEVLHHSEDPAIETFVPHVARTAADPTPLVWAVDELQAPAYWFPRDCPRVAVWRTPTSREVDRREVLGPSATRVHLLPYAWLDRFRDAQVYAYRFDAAPFEPYGPDPDHPYAWTTRTTVVPVAPPEPLGDLARRHAEAGIELRVVPSLDPWWERIRTSSLGFSGIRLQNA